LGAWIEIQKTTIKTGIAAVAPAWERGLKSLAPAAYAPEVPVAPAWERGLKFNGRITRIRGIWSLPLGSVD